MDIRLIPVGEGSPFTFPALPEKIQGKYGARYQSFDILSQGMVKVPRGTDVSEFTWEGVFFGESKRGEAIVRRENWKEPNECVKILFDFLKKGTVLNLIVTETWINVDVTISSFQPRAVGAYGNIAYTISFLQKKPLQVYTTEELQISGFTKKSKAKKEAKKTRPRNGTGKSSRYTVVSGDTLWGIAIKKLGNGSQWTRLYEANRETIEAEAKRRGKANSDHGHWIWPGEVLVIPG